MAKQSGYLQRREAELDATFNAGAAMAMQFAMDTLQMALHQTEGWGYDRIMRITHNWVAVQREYKPALDCRNPEADVRQEHMDRQREGGADPVPGAVSQCEEDQIREVRHGN